MRLPKGLAPTAAVSDAEHGKTFHLDRGLLLPYFGSTICSGL